MIYQFPSQMRSAWPVNFTDTNESHIGKLADKQ